MEIRHIVKEPQHHAYIVFGYTPDDLCAEQGEEVFVIQTERGLGVDEVRELQQYAFQSTGADERKIVLGTTGITFQAQNALLKMMEEAEQGTYFFLCLPQGTDILGTLLSRCYIIDKDSAGEGGAAEQFQQFITAPAKDRLAMIDKLWEQGESARHSAIVQLLQRIERHTHQCITATKERDRKKIMQYHRVTRNLRDGIYNGALHKATLQTLAFCD